MQVPRMQAGSQGCRRVGAPARDKQGCTGGPSLGHTRHCLHRSPRGSEQSLNIRGTVGAKLAGSCGPCLALHWPRCPGGRGPWLGHAAGPKGLLTAMPQVLSGRDMWVTHLQVPPRTEDRNTQQWAELEDMFSIHTDVHTCTHTHVCVHTVAHEHGHPCLCAHACACVCTHLTRSYMHLCADTPTHVCGCGRAPLCAHMSVCACAHTCVFTCTLTHTCGYTRAHAHTCSCPHVHTGAHTCAHTQL